MGYVGHLCVIGGVRGLMPKKQSGGSEGYEWWAFWTTYWVYGVSSLVLIGVWVWDVVGVVVRVVIGQGLSITYIRLYKFRPRMGSKAEYAVSRGMLGGGELVEGLACLGAVGIVGLSMLGFFGVGRRLWARAHDGSSWGWLAWGCFIVFVGVWFGVIGVNLVRLVWL